MQGKAGLGILIVIMVLGVASYFVYLRLGSPRSGNGEQCPRKEEAEELFEKGHFGPAARKLEERIKSRKGQDVTKDMYLLSQCYKHLGNPEDQKSTLELAAKEFPEGEFRPRIFFELGHIYVNEGRSYEARNALSDALRGKWGPEDEEKIKAEVTKLSEELLYSPHENPDCEVYEVKQGDTLGAIAKKYGTTADLIARVNRRKVDGIIGIGERLKIIKGTFHVEIVLSRCTLTLYLNNHFIKEYPAGVGKPDTPTPPGEFTMASKLLNPDWFNPPKELLQEGDPGYIPSGDPRNILGSRWMGFQERPRYGIHGTTLPETIGKHSSDGCIRMHNADVEEIFDFVTVGTKVIIRD